MNTIHKAVSSLSFTLVAVFAAACGDPVGITCQSANGNFAVQYTLVTTGLSAKCQAIVQSGDIVGLTSFNKAGAAGELPRYDVPGSLALQPTSAGDQKSAYVDGYSATLATTDHAYGLGNFASSTPNGSGICSAPTFQAAHMSFAAVAATPDDPATADVDESDPGLPAFEGSWTWSNLRLINTPDAAGTAFAANVQMSLPDEDGAACAIQYKAVGLYPAIPCNANDETKPLTNTDGSPALDADGNPTFEHKPDVAACNAEADPAHGHATGSGINPNFKTVCAEFSKGATYYCMLATDFAASTFGQ